MRTFILTFVLMLGVTAMAQENKETLKTVTVKEGKLTKVNIYHENGQLAQQGYLKNNKLHGKWVKYSENGNLLCVAKYNIPLKSQTISAKLFGGPSSQRYIFTYPASGIHHFPFAIILGMDVFHGRKLGPAMVHHFKVARFLIHFVGCNID